MTEAVVIRTLPLREYDRLAVLYSRDLGRTAAIARGALRPTSRQGIALDDGNLIRCHLVPGRTGIALMTGAQAQRSWANCKRVPLAWAIASFFLEVVDAVVYDGQPDEALWDTLTSILADLDAGSDEPLATLRRGQVQLLEVLGYGARPFPAAVAARSPLDDQFEWIAQRQLDSIGLMYQVAASRR
ncbi:MAG TPA: DNA repair protein RecO [Candidatus Paceibacterota bacterium]|nr:DNA repair protein RecO [Candidatus Paceibacterota bacterium]